MKISYRLIGEHVDLLNLILSISRRNTLGTEFLLSGGLKIVETELSAYGDSNILIKFKIKETSSDKNEIIVEQKCALTKNNLSEGTIGFSVENSEHSKDILRIIQFLTEELERIELIQRKNK